LSADAPIAVSLGDPAGIGPEIIAAAWSQRKELNLPPFFVVGGADVLEAAAASRKLDVMAQMIERPSECAAAFERNLPVLGEADGSFSPSSPTSEGATLAMHSLAEATRCALLGQASAVVTAPVAKAELAKVGFEYPGQTEFLAEVCGLDANDAVMMLAGPSLRAVPLTVHVAIKDVPDLLSEELIIHKAQIVAAALQRDFGIDQPRLAICGLNPHAGEGGKFGHEEADIIEPAIARLRDQGIAATGPHPGDALFTARARGNYDAALCMYHDQALIPLKALDFDEGVNVTLGLPIIRTSPDHGTAFDIAGKNIADPSAMIAALRMAAQCAAHRAG